LTTSGQDARPPPRATAPGGGGGPVRRSQAASLEYRLAWQLIRLALLGRLLRSRRFYQALAVGAITLVALTRIGQENRASAFARLAAWDKRQAQRLERKARQQHRAVQGGARMMRSRATKGLADRPES
jgi:hypothetical protein